jgi:uncharacterized protein YrrD
MERTIQFQKGASVLTANGQQIGALERVVLNPENKVVTDIVVRTGTLFSKADKVVPIEYVVETTENQVVLSNEAGELESFPPLEERHLVSENTNAAQQPADIPPVVYGSPGFGPMLVPAPGEQIVTQIEQNIPVGTVAMKEGAKVISADGKHVGNVERVLADPSVDQVTHLVISQGLFTKANKLIPISYVMTVGEDTVHLRVKKVSVEDVDTTPFAG